MALVLDGNGTIGGVSAVRSGDANIPAQAQDVNGVSFACRAWVNFDGTRDSTGAASTANTARLIRASGNVTSVVRNGAGDYTVNFTNALPDANYSVSGFGEAVGGAVLVDKLTAPATVSAVRISVTRVTGAQANIDSPFVSISIFR